MKLNLLKNKEVKNAGWIISGKVVQMLLSLFVGVLSTRFLGPENFGLISYAGAFVNFFMAFCTLGINSVIIKDFIDKPEEQGLALGTSILLRIVSSFMSAVMIIVIVSFLDYGETATIIVVALSSVSLVFHAFDTINYWFQKQYKSKITAISTFVAYVITAAYRIVLLIFNKNVFWFAFANSVDYIVHALLMLSAYKKYNGPRISFSLLKAKQLLGKSYHYILSGMIVAIYGQMDKLMLKQVIGETEVGHYSVGTTLCATWTFVLVAIIDSIYPTILTLHAKNREQYERKNRQLYSIVFYLSVFVSTVMCVFGDFIVYIMYGAEFAPAAMPVKIVTWYTAFSYLGVARNAWIVCENKQKYLKYMYGGAAVANIVLNLIFIPIWGASGAALATLLTQIFTSIIFPYCVKELRPNAKLMLQAILLKDFRNENIIKTKREG